MKTEGNWIYVSILFTLLYFTSTSHQVSTSGPATTDTETTSPSSSSSPTSALDESTSADYLTETETTETQTETKEKSPELSLVLMKMKTQLKVNQVFENERKKQSGGHGKIVLLGLFELTTKLGPRPEGLSELSAAQMAVQHINSKQLLPGYTLELLTNDTQVSFFLWSSN